MTSPTIPPKTKTFTVKDNNYQITFPNNKQYVQIQNMKVMLCPTIDVLGSIGSEGSFAESLVDAEAHFTVLCPSFVKDLAKPFGELSLEEGLEIVQIYANDIRPWYNEVMNFIFKANKEETKTTQTTSSNAG